MLATWSGRAACAPAPRLAVNPVSGAELHGIIGEIIAAPKPVRDRLLEMLGPGERK